MPITIPHRAAPLALAVFAMACGSSTDSADHKIADLEAPQFADKSVYEVDFNGLWGASCVQEVEQTLARLDGVLRVKAGWRSDRATIIAAPAAVIDEQVLNDALAGSFRVTALRKLRWTWAYSDGRGWPLYAQSIGGPGSLICPRCTPRAD